MFLYSLAFDQQSAAVPALPATGGWERHVAARAARGASQLTRSAQLPVCIDSDAAPGAF